MQVKYQELLGIPSPDQIACQGLLRIPPPGQRFVKNFLGFHPQDNCQGLLMIPSQDKCQGLVGIPSPRQMSRTS